MKPTLNHINFEVGEEVRVLVKLGTQKEKSWQKAKFVDYARSGKYKVEFWSDNQMVVGRMDIKKFRPLSDDALMESARKEFPELREILARALPQFHFQDMKLELQEEDCIITFGDYVSVQPEIAQNESILGIVERASWGVSLWRGIPATRWEPPDVDECNVGQAYGPMCAAKLVIDTLMKIASDSWFEIENENKLAKEWEQQSLEMM